MKAILMVAACVFLTNDAKSTGLTSYEIILRHLLESEDTWHQRSLNANGVDNAQCCEPYTLQGTMRLYRSTEEKEEDTEVKFYHDPRNCRLATVSSSDQLRTIVHCTFLDIKCTVYTIDERSSQCKRQVLLNSTLDDYWKSCLPRNSNNTGHLRLGADIVGERALSLQLWQFRSDLGKHKKLTTSLGCLPVAEIVSTDSWKKSGRLAVYYFDLDTKIRDMDVFVIPSYCHLTVIRKSIFDIDESHEKKLPLIFRLK